MAGPTSPCPRSSCRAASSTRRVPTPAVITSYSIHYTKLYEHTYLEYDFARLPVRPVAALSGGPLTVRIPFPGREVAAGVWLAQVGRVPLLLLTTDVSYNFV